MPITIPLSLARKDDTSDWIALPTDLSWSGYEEQLQRFDKDGLHALMGALRKAIPTLYNNTLEPSQAAGTSVQAYFPDTKFLTMESCSFDNRPLPLTKTNEATSISKEAARCASLAILFQTYAFLLRMFLGSQTNIALPPKDSPEETHWQYIFPLLKRAKELRDQAINLGLSSRHFINIPINYCLVGYARDKQISQDEIDQTLDKNSLQHAQSHSLTDYGYLQHSRDHIQDALLAWEKAGTSTALALVGEHHMKTAMNAFPQNKTSTTTIHTWRKTHHDSINQAERYLLQAKEKGNHQAAIRLVELYFNLILASGSGASNKQPSQDYKNCIDKAQTALNDAMLMHKKNRQAFAKEYQEDFNGLFNRYQDNDIQRIIHRANEYSASRHDASVKKPYASWLQTGQKIITDHTGVNVPKTVLIATSICALTAFLVKLGSSLDIHSFFNQDCDKHKEYVCG